MGKLQVKIMRSLPGGGKTTYRLKHWPKATVCSADDYHTFAGKYEFKAENAPYAHKLCQGKFKNALERGDELIVVDNTNTTAWEVGFYYQLAELFGYEVEIIEISCTVATAAARNIHGVPLHTLELMGANLAYSRIPSWWKRRILYSEKPRTLEEGETEDGTDALDSTNPDNIWRDTAGKAELEIGDQVHDMHNGMPTDDDWDRILGKEENSRYLVNIIRMDSVGYGCLIMKALSRNAFYGNKMLSFVGYTMDYTGWVFAWSYNNREFGLMEVRRISG